MIYLDANIFIHAILYEDEKAKKCKQILDKIVRREIEACTSFLSWDEVVFVVKRFLGRKISVEEGDKFLQFPNLTFIRVDRDTLVQAQHLMTSSSLSPRDAIHAASALLHGIHKIISDDSDFDQIKELKRDSL